MIINIKVNTINHTKMSNDKIIFIDVNCPTCFGQAQTTFMEYFYVNWSLWLKHAACVDGTNKIYCGWWYMFISF
jgi:hypothetical protein